MNNDDLLRRVPDVPTTAKLFTLVCFALPAMFGSALTFVYQGGAIVSFLAWATGRAKLSREPAALSLSLAIYAFVAINVVATLVNGGPHYIEAILPLLAFLGFPFSYAFGINSRKEEIAKAAIFGSAISCFGALALALTQVYFLNIRAEGGAGNALVFATVICITAGIVLAGLFYVDRRWSPLLGSAFAAGLVALIYSGSRIAWFAVAITALIVLFVHRRELLARASKRTVAVCVTLAFLVVLVSVIPVVNRVHGLIVDWQELMAKGDYSSSVGYRAALWQIGYDLFIQSPIIGHGQAKTVELIITGFREKFGLDQAFTHFHNGFLTAAVESGILGVAALLLIFVIVIRNAVRSLRVKSDPLSKFGALMLLGVASAYLCTGVANVMLGHDILDAMFLLTSTVGTYLALGVSALDDNKAEPSSPSAARQQRTQQNPQIQ